MYGTETTAAGGVTALAMTGLTTGSAGLVAVGLIMAGVLIVFLLRKNSPHRP